MLDLLMLVAHEQHYVRAMLNKRRYSRKIAVFDMSTVILHKHSRPRHHSLMPKPTVNETL